MQLLNCRGLVAVLCLHFCLSFHTACQKQTSSTTQQGEKIEDSGEFTELSEEVLYEGSDGDSFDASLGESCAALPGFQIVGGQAATPGDLTSLSTVHIYPAGCTGTLIGPRHVVTAAHCIANLIAGKSTSIISTLPPPIARFGVNKSTPDLSIEIKEIIMHPEYGQSQSKNAQLFDVALILLKTEVPAPFKPVAVGTPQELSVGRAIVLAGYGRYAEKDSEQRPLSWVKTEIEELIDPWAEIQLTTGTGKGGCYGDSGGPSYIVHPKTMCLKLVGVTHGPPRQGDGTCDTGGETVMNLTRYRGWLKCAYEALGAPLRGLGDDGSERACRDNLILNF